MALLILAAALTGGACQRSSAQAPDEATDNSCPAVSVGPESAQLLGLQDDLRLLTILDRMQLTADQINQMLPLVDQLAQQRAESDQQIEKLQGDLIRALTDKRQLLVEDKPVSEEIERQIVTLQSAVGKAREQGAARLTESAKPLRKLLTAPQLDIVTGRNEARLQARELLDWLRGLSDSDFTEEAAANAEGLADADKGLDKDVLTKLFATARKMTAAQYDKGRDELAARLAPLYGPSPDQEDAQIAGAFAHPHTAALLREKLKFAGNSEG
ncbi:MAG TPA: hypothetical protein VGM19_15125 [Armatimonadota bacterium]